jgi:hypothetical protein
VAPSLVTATLLRFPRLRSCTTSPGDGRARGIGEPRQPRGTPLRARAAQGESCLEHAAREPGTGISGGIGCEVVWRLREVRGSWRSCHARRRSRPRRDRERGVHRAVCRAITLGMSPRAAQRDSWSHACESRDRSADAVSKLGGSQVLPACRCKPCGPGGTPASFRTSSRPTSRTGPLPSRFFAVPIDHGRVG